jgi:dTDP-4-dehydrorhamnose 3,5-epimerase
MGTFATESTTIDGLTVIHVHSVTEPRGEVRELFRQSRYAAEVPGGPAPWSQINLSATKRGAVRGLHAEDMNKLVTVAAGRVFAVFLDTRPGSATRGVVATHELVPGIEVFVPRGVCNGFQALENSEYLYFFDAEWVPGMAGTSVTPLDPELGIAWPIEVDPDDRSQVSEKDATAPTLREALSGA